MKNVLLIILFTAFTLSAQRPADELLANYSSGVAVNTALNKAMAAVTGSGTINQLTYWNGTATISSLSTATYPSLAELAFVKGGTSNFQIQINGKANSSHTHTIANVTGLQTALDSKQATLVSGTNIKTINSQSLLGSGNIVIASDTTGRWLQTYNIVKSLLIGETITGTKATLDSMIVDFRKNNFLRLNK
jgi:hypothetical protein